MRTLVECCCGDYHHRRRLVVIGLSSKPKMIAYCCRSVVDQGEAIVVLRSSFNPCTYPMSMHHTLSCGLFMFANADRSKLNPIRRLCAYIINNTQNRNGLNRSTVRETEAEYRPNERKKASASMASNIWIHGSAQTVPVEIKY
ncbi:hypothetical protein KIN20_024694 [Parelaphostrongylus tenuis]|uniref:Uncharacterized protein n=1 Tax=Parelaphostrongylus tenuis TaxID=148309 RepID=A0AAD5QWW8_PARTN|nr:hypothetical protein KIN20_024694 [Parelaphostrongylus tenuis]